MTPLEVAVDAARRGAHQLMKFRSGFSVREKAPKDLVTDADLASQRAIFSRLGEAFPEHALVGEEEGHNEPPRDASGAIRGDVPCWIVDPLDGTVNYVHQLQSFCVSIALWHEHQLRVAVIYDPLSDELFHAVRGGGAVLCRGDGSQPRGLRTSNCPALANALLACSFPAGVQKHDAPVVQFCDVIGRARAVRRLGSCALNLCYVAAGRLDGYWATSVHAWDMAAGALIVREAGGTITDFEGGDVNLWSPEFVAGGQPALHAELCDVLRQSLYGSPRGDADGVT